MSAHRHLHASTLPLLTALLLLTTTASACSCYPSPLDHRVCTSALTVRATVLFATDACGPARTCNASASIQDRIDGKRLYVARVAETLRGARPKDGLLILRTALTDSVCGAELRVGTEYLLILHAADMMQPIPPPPPAAAVPLPLPGMTMPASSDAPGENPRRRVDPLNVPAPGPTPLLDSAPSDSSPSPDSIQSPEPVNLLLAGEGAELAEKQQTATCAFPWLVYPLSLCDFPIEWAAFSDGERAMLAAVRDGEASVCGSVTASGELSETALRRFQRRT